MGTGEKEERERGQPGGGPGDPLARLRRLLARPVRSWSESELLEFPALVRLASTLVARQRGHGVDAHRAPDGSALVRAAQAVLQRPRATGKETLATRAALLFLRDSPRAIRAEWRLCALTGALVYGLALLAWIGVRRDLDLAFSLLHPAMVEQEIEQLEQTAAGQPFRGNFTFGLGESPLTAGMILLHNIGIGILFFASALVPPLYLYILSTNGLMLGAYTGVAGHWGQAGAISSVLWTHGTLEIQALILAGTAGLVLARAWIRPGAYSRRQALVLESRRAMLLLAPVFPLLVVAGLIEGFVSPHAPLPVRLATAAASGAALLSWALLAGRSRGAS